MSSSALGGQVPGRFECGLAIRPLMTLLLVAGFLLGCGSASDHPHESSTMTILVDAGERYAMFRDQSRYLLFLPLVTLEGLEVRPRLARSWEHSPDYRTWTFHIREDVRWHDGVPVTAHDIVFSLELFAHPDVLWAPGIRRDYDSISVPDDHTIIVHLKRPASPPPVGVPFRPWVVFFPKHLLQDLDPADFSEWDFWSRPVGNGPYRFVRRVPQTMFELGANPDFYAGEPSIQRVVLKLGGASPLIELGSGGADVALYVTPTEALKLATDPGFVLYHGYDWSELQAIYWNQRHPLLADAAVRRALSHAIDRRALARSLSYPEEMPFAGGVSNEHLEDHPYRHGGWDQGPAYDPGLADRLLRQVGWIDRDGNGVRERAGREARFTLVSIPRGASRAWSKGSSYRTSSGAWEWRSRSGRWSFPQRWTTFGGATSRR